MPFIATLAESPTFLAEKLVLHPLAVPSRGSHELAVWNVQLPAGASSGAHSLDREQIVVVNHGLVTLWIDGERIVAGAGDALILPVGKELTLQNEGIATVNATVVSRAGFKATVGDRSFTPPWTL